MHVKKMDTRTLAIGAVLAFLVTASACKTVTPQTAPAAIAHSATDVVDGARALQQWVNTNTTSGVLPRDVGQQITTINQKIHDAGTGLAAALKQYNAITIVDLKRLEAAKVQALVTELSQLVAQALGVQLPPNIDQYAALVGKIAATVGAVQLEIAKGLGVS